MTVCKKNYGLPFLVVSEAIIILGHIPFDDLIMSFILEYKNDNYTENGINWILFFFFFLQ